jgi:hypothetical protein
MKKIPMLETAHHWSSRSELKKPWNRFRSITSWSFASICEYPSMGLDFLKGIHVHYDMNLESEMLIEKL